MKQKLVDGGEIDVVYNRRFYTYTQRAGVCKKIKTDMRRRARHEARRNLREGRFDG